MNCQMPGRIPLEKKTESTMMTVMIRLRAIFFMARILISSFFVERQRSPSRRLRRVMVERLVRCLFLIINTLDWLQIRGGVRVSHLPSSDQACPHGASKNSCKDRNIEARLLFLLFGGVLLPGSCLAQMSS